MIICRIHKVKKSLQGNASLVTVIVKHAHRKIVKNSLKSYDCYNHGICDSVKSCIDMKTCIQPNNFNLIIKLTKPFLYYYSQQLVSM